MGRLLQETSIPPQASVPRGSQEKEQDGVWLRICCTAKGSVGMSITTANETLPLDLSIRIVGILLQLPENVEYVATHLEMDC